jgi:hypothetical protein
LKIALTHWPKLAQIYKKEEKKKKKKAEGLGGDLQGGREIWCT